MTVFQVRYRSHLWDRTQQYPSPRDSTASNVVASGERSCKTHAKRIVWFHIQDFGEQVRKKNQGG